MVAAIDLDSLADRVRAWCESLRVTDAPFGTYRLRPDAAPTFYAAADVAILRWMIGDRLAERLSATERDEWAGVINAYQDPDDGRYGPEMGHHVLHANSTALNALSILGRRHRYAVTHYDAFDSPRTVGPWLSQIVWFDPWYASHLVWGGPVPWINSAGATEEWRTACFSWFDRHLDERTGSWPLWLANPDAPAISALGSAVHIWPLYRHTGRAVPGLAALTDLVLRLQHPHGHWDAVNQYGTMDALYVLSVALETGLPGADKHREAILRYLPAHLADGPEAWTPDTTVHRAMCWVSTLGYCQRALPERFAASHGWGDIFDHKEIYDLDAVRAGR